MGEDHQRDQRRLEFPERQAPDRQEKRPHVLRDPFAANGRCMVCGRHPLLDGGELHVGHIIDVAHGLKFGLTETDLNADENLIAQCDECNLGWGSAPLPLRFLAVILRVRLQMAQREEQ